MLWTDLIGHQEQYTWFRRAMANGRLATSFLFVGPDAIGKRTFARLLAKSLLCRRSLPAELQPCGACEDCAQVDASTHPDLIEVFKPAEKADLPVELLIGERDKRMREGLCHDINLKPYSGRRKIAILDDADSLNVEGANCLLKTLEEPPADSVLIMVGTGLQRQLPTIRSRCQAIVFRPLEPAQAAELLLRNNFAGDQATIQDVALQAGGSLAVAKLLADEELREFRAGLLASLVERPLKFAGLAKSCGAMCDAAGKETRFKRQRLRMIFTVSAELFRLVTLGHCPSEGLTDADRRVLLSADRVMSDAASRALGSWKTGASGAIACWQRCLTAIEQSERNANQAALLESWTADIASLSSS